MSPVFYGCVICGARIGDFVDERLDLSRCPEDERWNYEFRVLRINSDDAVELTGVGLYDDPDWGFVAPLNFSSRWDDRGYDRKNIVHMLRVMRDFSQNGERSFILHDACYQLLHDSTPPRSCLDLERLFKIFSSLPIRDSLLAWGHDYGGLSKPYEHSRYPWEAPYIQHDGSADKSTYPLVSSSFPGSLIAHEKFYASTALLDNVKAVSAVGTSIPDLFCSLPAEIVLMISELLSSEDYFSARSSSRAFWNAFDTSRFWLSRFLIGAERGWLFEVRQSSYSTADMQMLYRCSSERRLDSRLRNRRRICDLMFSIHQLIDLNWMKEPLPAPVELEETLWRDQEADIQTLSFRKLSPSSRKRPPFEIGCRVLERVESDISGHLIHAFLFYFSSAGDKQYLSGMQIQAEDAATEGQRIWIKAGYQSKVMRYYCAPPGSRILGFGLAVASTGIKAIQVHMLRNGEETVSEWFGDKDDCPKSVRIVMRSASAFRASFDGFKMVGLGLAESRNSTQKSTAVDGAALTLRRQAVWFPDIPSPVLALNETSFFTANLYKRNFFPLFWTCFGGEKGERLSSLTSIKVLIDYFIFGIRFGYARGIESGDMSSELGKNYPEDRDIDVEDQMQSFYIDGPAGERVTSATIKIKRNPADSLEAESFVRLAGITINTNFTRSHAFVDEAWKDKEFDQFLLVPEPGTFITGFYSHQYEPVSRCFSCLGIVSTVVEDPVPLSPC